MTVRRLAAAAAVLVGVAACGGDDSSDGADSVETTTTVEPVSTTEPGDEPTTSTTGPASSSEASSPTFERSPTQPTLESAVTASPVGSGAPIGPAASENLTAAAADLAARLGVDPADVHLVSEQAVTWRNSAIGCPEPGMGYLDRLVDGVRIVLEVGGEEYSYHAGGSRSIFYCEHPQLPGD